MRPDPQRKPAYEFVLRFNAPLSADWKLAIRARTGATVSRSHPRRSATVVPCDHFE
jgi:hypothetical protein